MKVANEITKRLKIEFPIIQGGMVWVSGWKIASAVSNNGGLGLIGSGSMSADLLREHIQKCKLATDKPFGVNLPLLRGDSNELINVIIEEKVRIVFTSAGNPAKYINELKSENIFVAHVVSNVKQAVKSQSVGCDAVVGEGVEAGGHNGKDEISTFTLIPQLAEAINIPVIAAGGIGDGRGIVAAMALGAQGVQLGTRFAATCESSAHDNYKNLIVNAKDSDTKLIFKRLAMARVIGNELSKRAEEAENKCLSDIELNELLGTKREKKGIFEGDESEGMMEAGQVSGLIKEILPVTEVFKRLISEFDQTAALLGKLANQG